MYSLYNITDKIRPTGCSSWRMLICVQNYSGDYGDLASFVTHMRSIAADKGSDLLLMYVGLLSLPHCPPLSRD